MSDLQSPPQSASESGPQLSAAHAAELESLLERIRTDFEVDFEPLHVDENPLEVLSIQNMSAHLDKLLQRKAIHDPLKDLPLWAKLWPGSFVLGRLLRKYEPQGKSLLELGAGCGALSLVAARYGFGRVVLSDVVEQALRFARANHLAFLTLEVRPSNAAAIALYTRFGFREAGRRRNYYDLPKEDALILTRTFEEDDQ